jgi:two-component system nitrogen regulation sensor histidine kinase NtrY
MRPRLSLEAQLLLITTAVVVGTLGLAAVVHTFTESWLLASLFTLALAFPLAVWAVHAWAGPMTRLVQALVDGVSSFKDGDFSISVGTDRRDELGDLARHYNSVGDVLRRERQNLFQRELLLDTVIQSTPLALVLTNANDQVIYSNTVARQMFNDGRRFEGHTFNELVQATPASLRDAVAGGRDTLFSIDGEGGEQEMFHLSQRRFVLNGRDHRLYLFKRLTRELTRQEVATWKKVIRVISHELNNSLAPISSLAHSGGVIARDLDSRKLGEVFATIEERSNYLKAFLEGYARFAKLPAPRPERVEWQAFLDSLTQLLPVRVTGDLPARPGWFDPAQVQQVLINLIKNAEESGSARERIELSVADDGRMTRIRVTDQGSGMPEQVLKNALLPFYSTKRTGTGLGLTLCREIAEAHGGRLNLANRPEGGLSVTLWLPGEEA